MTRQLILDVDTGTDDAIAIMMAGLSKDLDLLGCTTVWGNHAVPVCTANTLAVLDLIGRQDVPVHQGLGKPFAPIPFLFADHVDSEREIVHPASFPIQPSTREIARQPAVEWLVETLRSATEQITLVPVAPLTNIAAAVTIDPKIVEAVDEVVIMGGSHALGNVTPSAEANIWHDPVAADVVFRAGFERLVLVPLDATHRANVTAAQNEALRGLGTPAGTAAAALIGQRIEGYTQTQPQQMPDVAPVHDALCVAYLLDPSVIPLRAYHVQIETTGFASFGRTIVDTAARSGQTPNALVALDADADLFYKLLNTTLAGPAHIQDPQSPA
ncbi:nucleoside hydrolase [Pedococcus sp. 5OH_020]|uniref:nucleoside hydrolase n=1 Tax=Pedococcus sp. 5OH_020 TaxID=2989814 RepID=UPI0022E9EB84|nr:nucleoside hydrolase [Pedococcus sp. 5OH_020]